jgi:hypothetical protein
VHQVGTSIELYYMHGSTIHKKKSNRSLVILTPRVICVPEPEIKVDDTDVFIEWFTDHFLKHKASGKVTLI